MIFGIKNGVLKNNVINIDKFISTVNPNKIYLDVDGVIWHSCQAVCDVINKRYEKNIQGNEIMSWNFKELNSAFTNEDVEQIFQDYYFFKCVKWINGAFDFINKYKDKIIIITKGTPYNISYKMEYLIHDLTQHYNINIPLYGLPLDCSKGIVDMNNSLLIDDSAKNLNESNATYKIQFLEYKDNKNDIREWTKDWKGLRMYKW